MTKKFSIVIFLFAAISVQSQSVSELIDLGKGYIHKTENIDTNYVYQFPPRFSFALTSKLQMVGFFAYSDFKMFDVIPASSVSYLGESLYKKVGFEVGYGGTSFGYDVEIGRHSAEKRRALSFGMQNLRWGGRISYFGIKNYIISDVTVGEPGDEYYIEELEKSTGLGNLRNLSLDGYWVFNHRRFAYTATNVMNVVQKHTSGSIMLTSRFMWSDLDTKEDMTGLFESYSTIQFAIGGGYSANIVLWNRDEVNNDDRTVRNLTFNITVIPILSLVNYMETRAYALDINFADSTETQTLKKSDVWCYPSPNIMGSTALSLTWGRFYFTTQFVVNMFYFTSSNAVNKGKFDAPNIHIEGYDGDVITDLQIYGILYNWTLSGKLFYRF
ncbi:MAG: DUF4421 family protein [Bacteroidales bacterium]|nr:DUF4421 family protein [Bacteroidales bacterium]